MIPANRPIKKRKGGSAYMNTFIRKLNTTVRRMLSFTERLRKKSRVRLALTLIVLLAVPVTSFVIKELTMTLPVTDSVRESSKEIEFDNKKLEVRPDNGGPKDKIILDGWMPENAEAEAVDVTGDYAGDTQENSILSEMPWAKVIAAYDITIKNGNKEYQPNSLNPISVEIRDKNISSDAKLQLLHLKDDGTKEWVSDFTVEDGKISFPAKGFSVYAIVDIAKPFSVDTVSSLNDLSVGRALNGLKMYYGSGNYFTNALNNSDCLVETSDSGSASVWYFEKAGSGDNNKDYRIYTKIGGSNKYIHTKSGNNIELSDTGDVFEVSKVSNSINAFYLKKKGENRWLQHSGSGGGIRYYTSNSNATNSRIFIQYADSAVKPDDYLQLDGKTFGLMNYPGGTLGYAFMADGNSNSLSMMSLTVRKENGTDTLYVADNSDISMWTFHYVSGDNYKISTQVAGETKYLNIGSSLTLVSEENASEITIVSNSNKQMMLSSGGISVKFNGTGFIGQTTNTSDSGQWLHIVNEAALTQNDYVTYYADKVSVSSVPDGANVIVYTRVWNSRTESYDFFAIDHDGTLYPCYERGEHIMWVGNQINTLLWDFTEYHYEDGTPNNYYELYNPYSRKYIAPQIKDGQTLSDSKIGINLPGRAWGEYYSEIVAWDDPYYAYSGLQTDTANGCVVSGPKSDANTFYFATVQTPSSTLTTVRTIDNSEHGIVMKMIDFPVQTSSSARQNEFLGTDATSSFTATKGLLSTNLESNGYPRAVRTDQSLANLFNGSVEVNHLFLESTYNASGYFEYDSCQNYATLVRPNGTIGTDFTVYKELGTSDANSRTTLKHGQFFPYNSISAGVYCTENNPQNLYSALAQYGQEGVGILPETDPRKYERLHKANGTINYYNGMEMTATMTSTPNGKDAWGNDIIFEFTGDDDFWFYVDGELVIDLGGIHSALQGSCNFSTGKVVVEGVEKTLRQVFRENYLTRNPNATEQEINDFLDDYFDEGSTVFRPYTTHTMTVFYMERGAGASNLHMRYNLSNVTPGNVMLTKTVTGSDDLDFNLVEYPYQIWYKSENDNSEHLLTNSNNLINVTYQNSTQRVDYLPVYTPPNSSVSYNSVYLLNPGKSAEVHFPTNTIEYKIVECGINDEVYDSVKINGVAASPASITGSGRSSYDSGWISVAQRPSIVFENHVDPDSLRTISIEKTLFDESGQELTAQQDQSVFSFRLYLSNGTDDNLTLANMAKYYVTDNSGHLCRWNAESRKLVPTSLTDYDSLTDSEKVSYTFETSMNGAISQIPVGYVVHVPNITVGTKFMLVERENEIPIGYTFVAYERESGTYHAEDGDTLNSGWVRANESPKMYVQNKRGWGLDVNKEWSDRSFTRSHDPVYTAVYVDNTLVPGTVRRLTDSKPTTRYFFDQLISGKTFDEYSVHEVELLNPVVDSEGNVTSYDSITRKLNDGDLTTINAVPNNSNTSSPYSYCAEYTVGTPVSTDSPSSGLDNVRTDTITNTRTGGVVITLYDMHTRLPLADGVFTLTQGSTGLGTFTSDSHGRVTILYDFDRNVNYTLTETNPPVGYVGLPNSTVFSIADDDTVTVGGNESKWQTGRKSDIVGDKLIAYIDLYNEQFTLSAVKVDSDTDDPLAGAHFALYRSVNGIGGLVKDLYPMPGFGDLVTGQNGIIPLIDSSLVPGKYYLTETAAPANYAQLTDDIVFTITGRGEVLMDNPGQSGYLSVQGNDISNYIITIPNDYVDQDALLTITKTVTGSFGNRAGQFEFTLTVDGAQQDDEYEWTKNGVAQNVNLRSGDTFTLSHNESVEILLPQDTDITISEANEGYATSFKLGDDPAENVSTMTFQLTEDTTLAVTNNLEAPVPTGVFDHSISVVPFLLALVFITAVIIVARKRYKTKRLAAE